MLLYQRVISFHVHLYQYQYLYNTKIYIYIYIIYIYIISFPFTPGPWIHISKLRCRGWPAPESGSSQGATPLQGSVKWIPQSLIWWKCHEMNPLKPWLGRKSFCMDIPKEYQACGLVCKVRPPISQGQHSLSSMRSFTFGSSRILLQARCTCRIKKEMLIMNFKAASLHFAYSWWDFS